MMIITKEICVDNKDINSINDNNNKNDEFYRDRYDEKRNPNSDDNDIVY